MLAGDRFNKFNKKEDLTPVKVLPPAFVNRVKISLNTVKIPFFIRWNPFIFTELKLNHMSNTYNIGSITNQISLEADIDTVGLAASRAIVLDVNGTDRGTAVAHSVDATGAIAEQNIGDKSTLKGLRLSVFTKITLTGDDATGRATEADAIGGTYKLNGGDDGAKTFTNPTKTYIDPNVFLNFIADLT